MKKLLLALGWALCLLTTVTIQSKAQAQNVLPAYAYQIRNSVGTFTDISGQPGVVQLGADLTTSQDLKNGIFQATSETDATPTFQTTTTNGAATAAATVPALPLGFDFKIGGKPMKYFVVSALGGAYFSEGPLQVPTNSLPATAGNTNCIFAYPYQFKTKTSTSTAAIDANIAKPAPGKAPACYLISGSAGNHVLTVQHDYLLNGEDEWIFQFKFYEATGNIDFISKQIKADNAIPSKQGVKRYELGLSLVEIAANYLGNALANDPLAGMNVDGPTNTRRRIAVGQSAAVSTAKGWDSVYVVGNMVGSGRMFIDSVNFPETGRTISFLHPAPCPEHTPAYTAEYYSITNEAFTTNSWSAELSYNTAKFPDMDAMFNSGTILAVLSDSEIPDYTLTDGTFHLKGDQIGTAEVLCNQLPQLAYSPSYKFDDHNGYKISKNIPLSVTGLSKGKMRYIHLYAMSYTCDGFPAYSELCHTIPLTIPLDLPLRFNAVGLPSANAVTIDVAPADGLKAMIVKSSRPNRPTPSGPLAKGEPIGNDAQVMEILSAAGTPSITLDENEACYLFAFSVDDTDPAHPVYSFDALSLGVRAAYPNLPGLIDFAGMPYTPVNVRDPNIDKTFRDLPLGWTRETAVAEAIRGRAFGLGKPGYDNSAKTAMYAQIHSSSTSSSATKTEFDIVTPAIVCDKARVRVIYNIAMLQSPSAASDETEVYEIAPNAKDDFIIEYQMEGGAWTQCAAYTGDNMPDRTPEGYYPLEAQIEADGIQGQRLRFRFRYQGIMRSSDQASFCNIASIEIKELKLCSTPTAIREITAQNTDTEIGLSWKDNSTSSAPAQSFTVFYKPEADETYAQNTVNTPTAQLTGLQPQTTYAVYVAANCGDKGESENSLPASFSTLHAFPYAESMAQDPNIIKIIGGKPVSVPGPGPFARGMKSAVGPLPSDGTAADLRLLSNYPTANDSAFHPFSTYNTVVDDKAIPAAVGVREWVKEGWLFTPAIYIKDNSLPLKLKFKANSACMEGGTWVKGSLPAKFDNVKLYVLVSSNGSFTKNDVVETIDISNSPLEDQAFAIDLSELNGATYVAFYYNNPAANPARDEKEGQEPPEMLVEIYDLVFSYKGYEMNIDVQPAGAGTVTGAGEYPEGMSVNLEATAKQDFVFLAWKNGDNVLTTETTYTFNMPAQELNYTAQFRPLRHLVTLNVDPDNEAGMVSGGGLYRENDEQVTIKATPRANYQFVAWMDGENVLTTETTYTFTMPTTDVTYTAKFIPIYRLNLLINPAGTGSATGADYYTAGTGVKITATPNENYAFVAWMNGETEVSKDNPYTFNMPGENTNYTAVFRSMIHELKVIVASGRETGTVIGEDDYKEGTEVTLKATAKTGYRFKAWMNGEAELSKANPYIFTMPAEDVTYQAVFEPLYTLTLNPDPAEGGSASGDNDYVAGEEVTLTATANEDYAFVAWMNGENEVSNENPYTFTMPTENVNYTAKFRSLMHVVTLNVAPDRYAGLTKGGGTYKEGAEVEIEATAYAHHRFVAWKNGENTLATTAKHTFTMPGTNVTYTAVFDSLYAMTLENTTGGTVATAKEEYADGESVTVTATPNENYAFVAWMKGETQVSTDAAYTFLMPKENLTYKAIFRSMMHDVIVRVKPDREAGAVIGEGNFKEGTEVTLTATAKTGYRFKAWMDGTTEISKASPYTFSMPTEDVNYEAVFEPLYTLTLHREGLGSVTGAKQYVEGESVTITATPNENYAFVAWMNGENQVSTDATYTFNMPAENLTYTAKFESTLGSYAVSLSIEPGDEAGSVTGENEYEEGSSVTITATAKENYVFVAWMNGGTQISTEATYTFTMPAENVNYTAKFRSLMHVVTLNVAPGRYAGLTKGGGTYKEGAEVEIEANAYAHHRFVAWKNGETQISTDNPYTFTMPTTNVTYTAVFDSLYALTLEKTNGGTVSTAKEEYADGESVTVTATPNENYAFVAWMKGETQVSTDAAYTFLMPKENLTYKAIFRSMMHDVIVRVKPDREAGAVIGEGNFKEGTEVTLTATAKTGYRFKAWMDGTTEISKASPYTFSMPTEDVNYEAVFEPLYTLTLNKTVGGTVTGAKQYVEGESVTITATANEDYAFVAWMDGETEVSTDATYTFNMPAENLTYTAKFRPLKHDLTLYITPGREAGLTRGGGTYKEGTNVTIEAEAYDGYEFVAWMKGETQLSKANPYTFTMPAENVAYTAKFKKTDDPTLYNVTLNVTPQNAGSVTGGGSYAPGLSITIRATANDGYRFVAWKNGETILTTEANYTFTTPEEDVTYTAVFEATGTTDPDPDPDPDPETYDVTLNVTPQNAGNVTGHGQYEAGASVTITATANDGYRFVAWKNGETVIATTASHTFTMPAEDVAYTAVFEANGTGPVDPTRYNVTLNVTPQNAGSVTGHGQYEAGASVTVTATANSGYKFVAWKDGETVVATTASHTFTMPAEDVTYTAVFEATGTGPVDPTRYNVTLNVTPQNAGSVTGGGQYEAGASVTITATANSGYKFVAWKNDETTVATTASHTFTMPAENVTYTAVFVPDVANEKPLKSAFDLAAMDGKLHIRNLNGVTVKTMEVYSLNGQKLHLFSPNSREDLVLPIEAERMLLIVRLTTEQGTVVYKVYLN